MITNSFKSDFDYLINKIKRGENFTFNRWGDGELMILDGINIDIRNKGNGEFRYEKGDIKSDKSRDYLKRAFTYKSNNYYVGIACRCCVGDEKFNYMKEMSDQNDVMLTWANLFVNSNFKYVHTDMVPALKERTINLICNKNSNLSNLPFKIKNNWFVGTDAWVDDLFLIDKIKDYIDTFNVENEVFLFSAGPLSNILTYELHKYNIHNTYIDVGSIFDGYFKLKLTRGYLTGGSTLNKTCVW